MDDSYPVTKRTKESIKIKLPKDIMSRYYEWLVHPLGISFEIPIIGGWFQLSEAQEMANAIAQLDGQPQPYPDPNLMTVSLAVIGERLTLAENHSDATQTDT